MHPFFYVLNPNTHNRKYTKQMKMITIRKGKTTDAPFIASMIMQALHIEKEHNTELYQHIIEFAEREDTLCSWHRCYIATNNNVCVGLCLAYDAKDYHTRRVKTFTMKCRDGKSVSQYNKSLLEQEDEAGEGEYYIDSLAVVSSYRGHGIGKQLLSHAVKEADNLGLRPTLLVDPANTNAIKLYTALGFKYEHEQFAFGQIYHKYSITQ